jgi:hypothetical protein
MVKSPLARVLLCLAVLSLIGVTALALGTKSNFTTSADGRLAIATKGPSVITPRDIKSDAGFKTIAGNLSTYPFGTYFCCFGNTVAEIGSNGFPFTSWVAIAFTPSANVTVFKIEASVGTFGGTSEFELSLREDSAGVPGKVIKSFHMTNPPTYGSCCTLDAGYDKAGIALTGGTQYWIAATTSSKDTFEGGWAFNSTDMRGGYPIASYCKGPSTYCGTTDNGKWVAGLSGDPLPAYAILGN